MVEKGQNTHQTQETGSSGKGAFSAGVSSTTAYNPHLLRYLREEADLTQAELAKTLNTSVDTVAEWETGRRTPNQKHLQALEKFFKLPTGGFAVEMKDILTQDFSAAYFGDTAARERLEWADKHLSLGQALRIIPVLPKT
ncbi:helix-turn-helix transcriptional regulator [Candidatus Poribacteria bacterium]|nr:helix-turn-helix transcriptional regulator [Candidatus Poribacteria bacterium]